MYRPQQGQRNRGVFGTARSWVSKSNCSLLCFDAYVCLGAMMLLGGIGTLVKHLISVPALTQLLSDVPQPALRTCARQLIPCVQTNLLKI